MKIIVFFIFLTLLIHLPVTFLQQHGLLASEFDKGVLRNSSDCSDILRDSLIKYGKHPRGWCPLNYAIEMQDYTSALVLVDFLVNIDIRDENKYPLDRLSSRFLKIDELTGDHELLLKKIFLRNGKNSSGISSSGLIFHVATSALSGSLEFLDWLIHQGIDLHENNGYPFLGAVSSGRLQLVQHLLSLGIDLRRVRGTLNTAVSAGNLELVVYLWEVENERPYKPWGNPLYVAMNYLDIFEYLLEAGVDPNEGGGVLKRSLDLPEITAEQREYKIRIIDLLLKFGAKF